MAQESRVKISIITVVFNNKNGLETTAKSVIHQTAFDKIEWIVIDAKSDDGTIDVIEEYIHTLHTK